MRMFEMGTNNHTIRPWEFNYCHYTLNKQLAKVLVQKQATAVVIREFNKQIIVKVFFDFSQQTFPGQNYFWWERVRTKDQLRNEFFVANSCAIINVIMKRINSFELKQ